MITDSKFLMRIPVVLAGLALLATGLVYVSAMPDIQIQLALLALD